MSNNKKIKGWLGESLVLKVSLGYSDHGSVPPLCFGPKNFSHSETKLKNIYLILFNDTNEMPGELSHKNMISSHVKVWHVIFTCAKITIAIMAKK